MVGLAYYGTRGYEPRAEEKIGLFYPILLIFLAAMVIATSVYHMFDVQNQNEQRRLAILAEYRAQEEAAELDRQAAVLAEQQAEAARREEEVILMAKFLAGVNSFVENYGYSIDDLYTYAQCPINRVLNPNYPVDTIAEALMQEKQWVGFSESNEVATSYYNLAKRVMDEYYSNQLRPCSNKFCWAELRRDGVWLNDDFGNRYAHTWRYSSL